MGIAALVQRLRSGILQSMKAERITPLAVNVPAEDNPAVIEFVRRVFEVEGIRCVVAEKVEGVIQITTFAYPLTEDLQDAIYNLEDEALDQSPEIILDFHLRNAQINLGSTPVATGAEQSFSVWGNLDANSRRAPPTGKR
jgi:hypothetical protein